MHGALFTVEVVCATPGEQVLLTLRLEPGARVRDALDSCDIWQRFPQINPALCPVGIFGRRVGLDEILDDGDRIEIYRELLADPKVVRRQRAASARRR
ncbi:MAG: RnfH family protein [Stenotrophobium sp.]